MFKVIGYLIKTLSLPFIGIGMLIAMIGQCVEDIGFDEEAKVRHEMCYIDRGALFYRIKEKIRGC